MNDDELMRYSRQILLKEFDIEAQETLKQSSVMIVGAGGLGCPCAMYLGSAGVGQMILVDDDVVELSNLQRQIGHNSNSVGVNKVDSLKSTIEGLNPNVEVKAMVQRLDETIAETFIPTVDLVLDCSDNFATRFLLDQLCQKHKIPSVIGAAQGMEGQVFVFDHQTSTSCYSNVFHPQDVDEEQNCATSGVLAPVVGVVGSFQALLAIKLLTGFGESDVGKCFTYDFYASRWLALSLG
ncbi:MAG: molybdopterin-synthase adenylyltransferase MoeB [Cellvibrionales bacterium]|nr:molybdopterin-synthase adenylyltransferase MoeB [Cellvibrionales bacterium]